MGPNTTATYQGSVHHGIFLRLYFSTRCQGRTHNITDSSIGDKFYFSHAGLQCFNGTIFSGTVPGLPQKPGISREFENGAGN